MNLRGLVLMALTIAGTAKAEIRLENATFSGQKVKLQVLENGATTEISGEWALAQTVDLRSGAIVARVKSLESGYFAVILTSESDGLGYVVLFEGGNEGVVQMGEAIRSRRSTVMINFVDAFEGLKQMNGWSEDRTIRAMSNYFRANPAMMLSDFVDQVELGQIRDENFSPQQSSSGEVGNDEELILPGDQKTQQGKERYQGGNQYEGEQSYDGHYDSRYGQQQGYDPRFNDPNFNNGFDRYSPQPPDFRDQGYPPPGWSNPHGGYMFPPSPGAMYGNPPAGWEFDQGGGLPRDLPDWAR